MTREFVVIGAGPAGLAAAHELTRSGQATRVLEQSKHAGGISRTETYRGYRFDIGGHRFYTKVGEVQTFWEDLMGDEWLLRPRLSRIYYRGRFFPYPLKLWETLRQLGPLESSRILASYLWTLVRRPYPQAETLEEWVTHRFGGRLYRTFFKTYTEKVWGVPCTEIRADWAAQRIKTLSLGGTVRHALFGDSDATSLIEEFHYPPLGPGQMWERCVAAIVEAGGDVSFGSEVTAIRHDRGRVESLELSGPDGGTLLRPAQVISSMPLNALIECLDPAPPEEVLAAARALRYRDFLVVALILDQRDVFPDNWIYVHSPRVKVGRIQNFKNWSPAMVPDEATTCLGLEYFANRGDELWSINDEDLIDLAERELHEIGLCTDCATLDATVVRQPMAYPVYDEHYRKHVDCIRRYVSRFENLQTIGRAGMHRYNNQDHSILTGLLAAKNALGGKEPLWDVNVERSYHESFTVSEQQDYDRKRNVRA